MLSKPEGKKVLMTFGGWDGHTPRESTELFAGWLSGVGFEVEKTESLDVYLDSDALAQADLIVQCVTMSEITAEQSTGLRNAVRAGTGFAGWHGGIIDSFRTDTEYQWMTGGQWVSHPGNCIPSYTVEIADSGHPITRGIDTFTLTDTEQYYLHVDPGNHVLCKTTFSGEHGETGQYPAGTVMPYAWTRRYGEGKVFVAAWGHTFKDFDVPEALEIVRRGLLWACRSST
jgi:hypothetical protein